MAEEEIQDNTHAQLVATFGIGDALYGINATEVQEVVRVGDLTRVYHAADYILGIINLRGKIVTIIDLSRKLGMEPITIGKDSRIIILGWTGEFIGLLVDSVSDVVPVDWERLSPPPSNVKGVGESAFRGVYNADGRLITILDTGIVIAE